MKISFLIKFCRVIKSLSERNQFNYQEKYQYENYVFQFFYFIVKTYTTNSHKNHRFKPEE